MTNVEFVELCKCISGTWDYGELEFRALKDAILDMPLESAERALTKLMAMHTGPYKPKIAGVISALRVVQRETASAAPNAQEVYWAMPERTRNLMHRADRQSTQRQFLRVRFKSAHSGRAPFYYALGTRVQPLQPYGYTLDLREGRLSDLGADDKSSVILSELVQRERTIVAADECDGLEIVRESVYDMPAYVEPAHAPATVEAQPIAVVAVGVAEFRQAMESDAAVRAG